MFREGLGFALAVCFLTVSAAAQDGDSSSNEASDHIAAALLLEGEKDTIADALVEWELAWESSGSLEEKDRREILEAMERLRAQTSSSGKKGERPPVWNVLHVAVPSVNVIDNQSYYGDFYGSTTHYNFKVDPNALRAVKKGFEAALDRLNVATKGRISFKGDFITLRKPIKKLDRIRDRSFWLSPENLTEAAPQWSNGKYQIVIASLINPTEDKENFNFTQEWISRPGAESVGYVNMLWYPLDAIDNALRGRLPGDRCYVVGIGDIRIGEQSLPRGC